MPLNMFVRDKVSDRVDDLDIPFNEYGRDQFGISKDRVAQNASILSYLYDNYFSVKSFGVENIPSSGRAMIVSNHSGGIPIDATMILVSVLMDKEPPRLAHAMVDKFVYELPFLSKWYQQSGQMTGLPENCVQLLEDERLLMIFPEGTRGVGKLYKNRYHLVRFGTGFMRLALKTNTPIIPTAFVGGEEVMPTMFHLEGLAKLVGAPYIPVPMHLLPVPLPVNCQIYYGEPIHFDGDGTESDQTIKKYIDRVKEEMGALIDRGLERREKNWMLPAGEAVVEKETDRSQ